MQTGSVQGEFEQNDELFRVVGYVDAVSPERAAQRLLVDGRTRTSRGVVEDRLWIFHAIRVRREVEDERHLAAGRRGTGWVGEIRRWRRLRGIKFNLTHWLISTQEVVEHRIVGKDDVVDVV